MEASSYNSFMSAAASKKRLLLKLLMRRIYGKYHGTVAAIKTFHIKRNSSFVKTGIQAITFLADIFFITIRRSIRRSNCSHKYINNHYHHITPPSIGVGKPRGPTANRFCEGAGTGASTTGIIHRIGLFLGGVMSYRLNARQLWNAADSDAGGHFHIILAARTKKNAWTGYWVTFKIKLILS